jgi:DNA-binding response OmpR family regulator
MSSQILIVNNQPQMVSLISDKLKQIGHSVTNPVDSYVALELVESSNFSLIILDDQMPLMSVEGFIESLAEARVSAPVILLSGASETIDETSSLGVSNTLRKPFQMDILIESVETLLDGN